MIGHRDIASWNIICHHGMPVDLAQAYWLCAKLHDDIVAENENLRLLTERAQLLRAIVEGYGLSQKQRAGFIDFIIHFSA